MAIMDSLEVPNMTSSKFTLRLRVFDIEIILILFDTYLHFTLDKTLKSHLVSKIITRGYQYPHSCPVGFHTTLAAYQLSVGTLCDGKQANQPLQAIHRRRR